MTCQTSGQYSSNVPECVGKFRCPFCCVCCVVVVVVVFVFVVDPSVDVVA